MKKNILANIFESKAFVIVGALIAGVGTVASSLSEHKKEALIKDLSKRVSDLESK